METVPVGEVGSVTDTSVKLSCGCVVTYVRGDLTRGQMFLCHKHVKEDIFATMRVVEWIASKIRSGVRTFTMVEGR